MKTFSRFPLVVSVVTLIVAGTALAQPAHEKTSEPKKQEQATPEKTSERVGDPYPLGTCPITGKKLGTMGDPVVKLYDSREVRFCCPACPDKFEKDKTANLAKIDEKIVKDQGPLYPLTTSLVTAKALPAKPFEFVYGNRLVRLGAESEKAEFLKDPKKYLAALNQAVVERQGAHYALKNCLVSNDELGGDMGKPVDFVVGGRLIRLCCKDCKKDVEADPVKFIALVDAARKGESATTPDHDKKDTQKPHEHGK